MDDRHQPGPVDAGVEAQRERRAARRQELARRAAEGNSLPAASTTSRTRRLFLFDGPDYEWEEGHVLTMSFRAGEKSYSVDLQTAGITERELRRITRAAAHAPQLVHELLIAGRAAHIFEALETIAANLEGPTRPGDLIPVTSKGGRLGAKKEEREE